ncbi:MAG: LysM peptidoglycan-binding domain-containing M23 family metallopeptidase [Candidatus Hydrogenedentota bacterium]
MRVDQPAWRNIVDLSPRPPAAPPATSAFETTLAAANQQHGANATYTVQPGDTLSDIVLRHIEANGARPGPAALYRRVAQVAEANGLPDADRIMPGQRLDLGETAPAKTTPKEPVAPTPSRSAAPAAPAAQDAPPAPSRSQARLHTQTTQANEPDTPQGTPAPVRTETAYPLGKPPPSTWMRAHARLSRHPSPSARGGPAATRDVHRTVFQDTADFSLTAPEEVDKAASAATYADNPDRTAATPWAGILDASARLSSDYGQRKDPFSGRPDFHHGIDLAAKFGSRVRSLDAGTVTFSGWQPGYGKVVIVDHHNGRESVYGHNASNMVAEGDRVDPDSVIALVGTTGRSTGPHLHFEIREDGEAVNPMPYLTDEPARLARR